MITNNCQLANFTLHPPKVDLGSFVRPEHVAALQTRVIVDLLNKIEDISDRIAENCEKISQGIDDDIEIDAWQEDDDEDDLEDDDDRNLLQHLAYLLTAVVSATAIPNLMLPYDQTEYLSFDNRPRASHNSVDVAAESLDGDGAEGLDSDLIG